MAVLSLIFFILFCGNFFTTYMVIRKKLKNRLSNFFDVRHKYSDWNTLTTPSQKAAKTEWSIAQKPNPTSRILSFALLFLNFSPFKTLVIDLSEYKEQVNKFYFPFLNIKYLLFFNIFWNLFSRFFFVFWIVISHQSLINSSRKSFVIFYVTGDLLIHALLFKYYKRKYLLL